MKEKIISIILIVLGLVLIGYGSIGCMEINKKKLENKNIDIDNKNIDINKGLQITDSLDNYELKDLKDEELTTEEKMLYYLPANRLGYYPKCVGIDYLYTTFGSSKISNNEVPVENLFRSAFRYLNDVGNFKQGEFNGYMNKENVYVSSELGNNVYDVSLLKDTINKLYGVKVNFLPEEVIENSNEKYKLVEETKYFGYYDFTGCKDANEYYYYFNLNDSNSYVEYYSFLKKEQTDSTLDLYVKVIPVLIKSDNNIIDENTIFSIYKYGHSKENDRSIDEYIVKNLNLLNTFKQKTSYSLIFEAYNKNKSIVGVKTFKEQLFEKYGDLATTYKVSFVVNEDSTYKWISTEPVE